MLTAFFAVEGIRGNDVKITSGGLIYGGNALVHTLFALIDGVVTFKKKLGDKSYVSVVPMPKAEA